MRHGSRGMDVGVSIVKCWVRLYDANVMKCAQAIGFLTATRWAMLTFEDLHAITKYDFNSGVILAKPWGWPDP